MLSVIASARSSWSRVLRNRLQPAPALRAEHPSQDGEDGGERSGEELGQGQYHGADGARPAETGQTAEPRGLRYNGGMSEAIVVTDTVRVPPSALTVHAVRASGPGGQNVNKVATKIDLRVDLAAVEGLSDAGRTRLRVLAGHRLDADGRLVITSQATRNQ